MMVESTTHFLETRLLNTHEVDRVPRHLDSYLTRRLTWLQHSSALALASTLVYINPTPSFRFPLLSLSLFTKFSGKKGKRKVQRVKDFDIYDPQHKRSHFYLLLVLCVLPPHSSSSSSFLLSTTQPGHIKAPSTFIRLHDAFPQPPPTSSLAAHLCAHFTLSPPPPSRFRPHAL